MRQLLKLVLTLTLALALAGAGATLTGCRPRRLVEREGGTLRVVVPAGSLAADPHRAAAAHPGLYALYDPLLSRDASGALVAGLAKSFRASEDGRAITLELREGVAFHDGLPLDGAAVKAALLRLAAGGPKEFPVARLLGAPARIDADAGSVTIHYDQPFPPAWTLLTDPRMAVVSPAWLTAVKTQPSVPATPPAGTGPYRWLRHEGEAWVLGRNQAYAWPPGVAQNPGAAYPDELWVVPWAADVSQADVVWWPPGQALPGELSDLTQAWRSYPFPGAWHAYLAPVFAGEPFDDARVRRALSLAVDRRLVAALAPQSSLPAGSVLSAWAWAWAGAWIGMGGAAAPDRAAAADLLQQAGWLVGPDGLRRRGDTILEVRLATYENEPAYAAMGAEIAAQLASVGIRARLAPPRRFMTPGLVAGAPNLWLLFFDWPDPDVLYHLFHSQHIGATNRAAIADPELDALLERTRWTSDARQRKDLLRQIDGLLLREAAVVPLAVSRGELRFSERVVGWRPTAPGDLYLQDVYLRDGR
jgi:peptide/nickel transport system substrate-binding protein